MKRNVGEHNGVWFSVRVEMLLFVEMVLLCLVAVFSAMVLFGAKVAMVVVEQCSM